MSKNDSVCKYRSTSGTEVWEDKNKVSSEFNMNVCGHSFQVTTVIRKRNSHGETSEKALGMQSYCECKQELFVSVL